jgi:hypothetical protein
MTAALQDPRLWEVQRRRFPIVMECVMPPGDEPCTQVRCRYHLAQLGVSAHHREPTRDCALSVANEGPRYLDEVAAILGITGERVRQIEERALRKLHSSAALRRLFDESD